MKLWVVAVGQRVPDWARSAWDDYSRRLPSEWRLQLRTIRTEPRAGQPTTALQEAERGRIEAVLPRGAYLVALDERGERLTTAGLAQRLNHWLHETSDLALLIGGPDGLSPALRERARETIRLSDLTLPHALARVLLIEQLYRAWSLLSGHPYHRE